MSTNTQPPILNVLFDEPLRNYVLENMRFGQLDITDTNIPHLINLTKSILDEKCILAIPSTVAGLPPLVAEQKYKKTDGLRIKRSAKDSFIILTPFTSFVIMKADDKVVAVTYPLTQEIPDQDTADIMAMALVEMGGLILNTVNSYKK